MEGITDYFILFVHKKGGITIKNKQAETFIHKHWPSILWAQIGMILLITLVCLMNVTTPTNAYFNDKEKASGTITAAVWEVEEEKAVPVEKAQKETTDLDNKQKSTDKDKKQNSTDKEDESKNHEQTESKEDTTAAPEEQKSQAEKETTTKDDDTEESTDHEPVSDRQSENKNQDETDEEKLNEINDEDKKQMRKSEAKK
ncbi:SipW-dependent-type signal peptide-containing protein [Halobacillus ihumii]|uniref:SipW-dependent-type signal peptide-containing protein n=1 Tax=Halobacillus ihumii TaxID=2686092 RepID=UPI0013D59B20|nr:SipW-dependent-type signal peptide-containing protein [Halobacillus ihumii]